MVYRNRQMLPTYDAQKGFELNYTVQAKPWLVLQPAVQYYANLSANSRNGNAAVAGSVLRLRSDPRHRKEGFNEDPARSIPEHREQCLRCMCCGRRSDRGGVCARRTIAWSENGPFGGWRLCIWHIECFDEDCARRGPLLAGSSDSPGHPSVSGGEAGSSRAHPHATERAVPHAFFGISRPLLQLVRCALLRHRNED